MTYVKRTLSELLDRIDPAWPLVEGWIAEATNVTEVLPPADTAGESLVALQVTTHSPLGAVIFHTGGVLIDHGWLRVLGSGHPRLPRSLPRWNFACGMTESTIPPRWVLVADDVVGGLFALNGGRFAPEGHTIWYFAPDTLEWEDTGKGYTDFLKWCLYGDLEQYYADHRWAGWQTDVRRLQGDDAFSVVPPLSTDDLPIERRTRTRVSVHALFRQLVGAV
jgi:hypothetical protein